MSPAIQQCGECGSPLRPCKCERAKEPHRPRRIKVRSFREVHKNDPLTYGVLYDRIARSAKAGECILKDLVDIETGDVHECSDQWRATAHHSPTVGSGGNDRSCGPVCGFADDLVHGRRWGSSEGRVFARYGVNVRDTCKEWGRRAIAEEFGNGLPKWLQEVQDDQVFSGL